VNDQLISCSYPLIDGTESYPDAHINRSTVPINDSIKNKIKWLISYFDLDVYNTIIIKDILYLNHNDKDFIYNSFCP
jgi:hypothetical protein